MPEAHSLGCRPQTEEVVQPKEGHRPRRGRHISSRVEGGRGRGRRDSLLSRTERLGPEAHHPSYGRSPRRRLPMKEGTCLLDRAHAKSIEGALRGRGWDRR
ncbi:hypothetical protein GOODEAATRI_021149 [Goodea atripinnis]|uniref:Uncharacterized protein n=1 Tax=Goodea atripinnis TaxID=208336 RepID=A0ABV0N379_9TELE